MDSDSSTMDESATLNMLASKVMPLAVNPAYLAYCPTMDLVALATVDEHAHVYRLSGQRVFGVSSKQTGSKIRGLAWKPSGQLLAVAFDDGSISLVSSHTGKIVHQIQRSAHSDAQICCLAWEVNLTDVNGMLQRTKNLGQKDVTVDDIINRRAQMLALDAQLDLPHDLATLDIEGVLPRLSALPANGKDDEVFSTRASLDAIFHPTKGDSSDTADTLLAGCEDGTIYVRMYDFFEIGIFSLRRLSQKLEGSRAVLFRAHAYSSTHGSLVSVPAEPYSVLYHVPIDLRLIPTTGRYLSLLASKSTQLHNILRYIKQVQTHMYSEFKATQDLPSKFIQNIEVVLQEKFYCSWVDAAYHLVVTGNCYPPVKEWLVDELGERGHKRWEKGTTAGYENLRRLTHENLLPALERFGVLVSRLRGLSKFEDCTDTLGLSKIELDDILDTVNCLQLLAHTVLICTGTELRQFAAFSTWMRQEIDVQARDVISTSAEETADKDSVLDHQEILAYIQGAMQNSQLIELFNIQAKTDERSQQDLASEGRLVYEVYKKAIKAFCQGNLPEKKLSGLDTLTARLDTQCNAVFSRIAGAQNRQVRFGSPILLHDARLEPLDMKLLVDNHSIDTSTTYVAVVSITAHSSVIVYRITLKVKNGISSPIAFESAGVQLCYGTVADLKFVDDKALMIALSTKSSSQLISIPYRDLSYQTASVQEASNSKTHESVVEPGIALQLSSAEQARPYVRHDFPSGPAWTPERLEINGRKGRRVLCSLAQDRIHYRLYDLDNSSTDEAADGDGSEKVEAEDGGEMVT